MSTDWYVYIVKCADDTLYTGITTDLTRRIEEHNHNNKLGSRYTKTRRPVVLVYSERHTNRSLASVRENEIKKMPRIKKEALISETM